MKLLERNNKNGGKIAAIFCQLFIDWDFASPQFKPAETGQAEFVILVIRPIMNLPTPGWFVVDIQTYPRRPVLLNQHTPNIKSGVCHV